MSKLQLLWGLPLGILNWVTQLLIKAVAVLTGPLFGTIAVLFAHFTGRDTLGTIFWVWDNPQSGYHNRGLNKDLTAHMKTADGRLYKAMKEKGWSDLRIALNWTVIRNPANNLGRHLGCDLSKTIQVIYSFSSFSARHGDLVEINGKALRVRENWVPLPERVRVVLGFNKTFWDLELIRQGWLYYPMIRTVICFVPGKFKVKMGGGKHTVEVFESKHRELIFGFKIYNNKVHSSLSMNYKQLGSRPVRTPTINFAYRLDREWA